MSEHYTERDLWWEARQKTASRYKGMRNLMHDSLFALRTVSLPGAPTKQTFVPTAIAARSDVVWIPDFNKYRKRDLLPYVDAGAKAFMLRIGGPTQWVLGDHRWKIDETWYNYMEQADRYGVLGQTIGYIVHSPFEPWTVNGATGETLHTELIDEWTNGGYMPQAFCYDHEIGKCWNSVGRENNANGYTLVTSLAENTNNTYKKYKRTVAVYTAKWFANLNADYWQWHDTYFTNINKPEAQGGAGTQRPLMLAWYGQQMTKQYNTMTEVGTDLFVPTPSQVGNFLWIGYQANSWQFSSTVKLGGDTVGVDVSISLDPFKQFYYNFGLEEPGTVPPPPPPPPDEPEPPTTGEVTRTEFDALKLAFENHTHETGKAR